MDSVEQAVALSMKQNKVLVVYITSGDDRWLDTWFHKELANSIKPYAIWLKLLGGSEQFRYFEALFPSVAVPSLYLVKQGKLLTVIKDNDSHLSQADDHWETLRKHLKAPQRASVSKPPAKTFREEVVETSQQKYHEGLVKQRKIEREERERILRLVEADKAERKARQHAPSVQSLNKANDVHENIKDLGKLHAKKCTLLIRLTNGNTLTKEFDPNAKLNDVRTWVDLSRTDGDCPYSFHRNIPRITFTDSDELKTLTDLELLPRSALILKPFDHAGGKSNVADAKGPGLLGKVFGGISAWWATGNQENISYSENNPHNLSEIKDGFSLQQHADNCNDEQFSRPASHSEQKSIEAETPSNQVTPAQSTSDQHVKHNTSELSLPSRCVTPNVYQFVNKEDEDKEPSTYNGNNINLGTKSDDV